MKVGIQLIGPRISEIGKLAKAAEDRGLDGAWLPLPYGMYTGVGRLVEATKRIRIGTSIAPLFHGTPYMHAASAAMLQEMSEGRFVLGVGSQTKGQVRTQAGFDPPKPAMMARDMVRAIRALLNGEGKYEGEYYSVTLPMPRLVFGKAVQPPPPILFSGVNPLNLRVSGEVGDGLIGHPIFTRRYLEEVVWPRVSDGLERGGRNRDDFEMVAMPMVWIVDETTSREEGYQRAKRNLAHYYSTRAYGGYMEFHGWEPERDAIRAVWQRAMDSKQPVNPHDMEAILSDEIVDQVCLIGSANEVRDMVVQRYEGIADSLIFYSLHDGYAHDDEEPLKVEANLSRVIDAFAG
jgi:probable F420-dependent oxidoreductase